MKGFRLRINGKNISAEVRENGYIGITLTNKEGPFRICFGGIDKDMKSFTYYASDLTLGDKLNIFFENNIQFSEPIEKEDVRLLSENDILKRELELYWKLKEELKI